MKHKTALRMHIDWMENQLKECSPMSPAIPFLTMAIQKAKYLIQMEKEQIIKAHTRAYLIGEDNISIEIANERSEQYYNETYNK